MTSGRADWRFAIPATFDAAEAIVAAFKLWRSQTCERLPSFPAELLLREALTNSVVHGCSENPQMIVDGVLRLKPNRLLIAIRDEGEGFDWHSAWDHLADAEDTTGRGVQIYRAFADGVRFNDRGNSVVLIKKF